MFYFFERNKIKLIMCIMVILLILFFISKKITMEITENNIFDIFGGNPINYSQEYKYNGFTRISESLGILDFFDIGGISTKMEMLSSAKEIIDEVNDINGKAGRLNIPKGAYYENYEILKIYHWKETYKRFFIFPNVKNKLLMIIGDKNNGALFLEKSGNIIDFWESSITLYK